MKDRTLLYLALGGSLLGLFLLFVISQFFVLQEGPLSEDVIPGTLVAVGGRVVGVVEADDVTILELEQECTRKTVVFESDLGFKEGMDLRVVGRVEEYKGEQEVIAEKIEVR